MSALRVPCDGERRPDNPRPSIAVDTCEGSVYLDVDEVTEPNYRKVALTPDEARALSTALLHFAKEAEPWR